MYVDCASACPPSCSAVGEGAEGSCREGCVSGCECPPGLFWDGALCVPASRCPCYHRRQRYAPGDVVRQLCNPWWVRRPCCPPAARPPLIPRLRCLLNLPPLMEPVVCDLSWDNRWPSLKT